MLKLKERKRELEKYKKANEGTSAAFAFLFFAGLFWILLVVNWIKDPCKSKPSYILGFIIISAIISFFIFVFRQEWKKKSEINKKIKAIEKQIQELENPSRKVNDMSTIEQLIYYINLKESLKDQEQTKSKWISWIISGIKTLAIFIAYLVAEKHLFRKEIEQFFSQNPNYEHVVKVFMLIAFWGVTSCLFGMIGYFIAKSEAKKLERQVRQLERELIKIGNGKTKDSFTRIT